jgi:hypothetical protein
MVSTQHFILTISNFSWIFSHDERGGHSKLPPKNLRKFISEYWLCEVLPLPVDNKAMAISAQRRDRLYLLSNEYWAVSSGVKRPGREADYSPPASAEVKKMWIYTFIRPYAFTE